MTTRYYYTQHTQPAQGKMLYFGSKGISRKRISLLAAALGVGILLVTLALVKNMPLQHEVSTQAAVTLPVETALAITEPSLPMSVQLEVQPGDTLLNMLTDSNVDYSEAHEVVEAVKKIYNPKSLNVGQNLALNLDRNTDGSEEPQVASLDIAVSPLKTIKLTRGPNGQFRVRQVEAPLVRKMARAGGTIRNSLYETGMAAGMSPQSLNDIITAFSYDVDFQRDIKAGDRLDVLYERYETKDGYAAGSGNIVYAALSLRGKELKIYRFKDKAGNSDFYNELGESIRKALLKTPINGARLTSGFGVRRHPILGYTKMHKGVDFAAPTGTPVYAAGDGVVSFASRKGGYGNYLQIKHNDKYASAYGHLSRFASGISAGKKVRQGQVVAYVGTTGMSTGPHLHYEILTGGKQINPNGVKFKTGNALAGKDLGVFKTQTVASVKSTLATLAMNSSMPVATAAAEPTTISVKKAN